jgi:peptidyl-dipeptidase A
MKMYLVLFAAGFLLAACGPQESAQVIVEAETAEEFVARVNEELVGLNEEGGAAAWVRATYITEDTAVLSARADEKYAEWHSRTVAAAAAYDGQELDPSTRRALDQLKLGTSLPAPDDADKRRELARLATDLKGMYGAGQYCRSDNDCMSLQDIENTLAESRDFDQLKEAWTGWRTIAPPMREKFERYVELANEGAAELGYADLGDKWRAGYDMTAAEFQQETTKLWGQVEPPRV